MKNFWKTLQKPITALAPMDGVTDTVFRQMISSIGKPSVLFTEFASTDGFCSKGKEKIMERLKFAEVERPIVAQIWGSKPEKFEQMARELQKMGFDGIDINMGCPDAKVVKNGGGSALILNTDVAVEIIKATQKGAPNLPISVKTRIGFKEINTEEWVKILLLTGIAALIVHGRTAKEQSVPDAHWDEIGKAVKLRDELGLKTIILGNGDVKSYAEVKEKVKVYGVDGVMIGRGVFANAWVFNKRIDPAKITPEERIKLLLKHLDLWEKTWDGKAKFAPMKKFVKTYIHGFDGASTLRAKLMETNSIEEVRKIFTQKLKETF